MIGDASSVKITFGTAERPISARPGKIRKIVPGPGPSDYKMVNPDTYKKRSNVIPNITFPMTGRNSRSVGKIEATSKSPAPNLYRPKSAVILNRSPTATIGKEARWNERKRIQSASTPGPNTYNVHKPMKRGPSAVMTGRDKESKRLSKHIPGPADYAVNYIVTLKREPRITIGNAK